MGAIKGPAPPTTQQSGNGMITMSASGAPIPFVMGGVPTNPNANAGQGG